jgi:dihydrofolate reductase
VAPSLEAALALVRLPAPAFCIGGAELYAAALPHADEMHVTEVPSEPAGDTLFPAFDRNDWIEVARRPGAPGADGQPACQYVTLRRARSAAGAIPGPRSTPRVVPRTAFPR